ncbi:glycoside hydrolase family 28 protein [Mixia osmundae IAM 14324]|uniref:Pectate lyase domain-containing protein n=1 Tax=Mixia osmundae (strain CBS 9802 / IAM 14324 / JCM 22182 / KY 12970) TaxID=764103 RepID=G7DTY3_MIXOS|nr:glycoside hydrolase family 28 protein [Mixia osmundae IAM 14324]KEI41757.1 glycoside hydrolase family 28 protein [Mixia osmundae IAM 14324]GAA94043.1 hypothetical protein E5Q_00690 [Mixia osmundae IAM 14324]
MMAYSSMALVVYILSFVTARRSQEFGKRHHTLATTSSQPIEHAVQDADHFTHQLARRSADRDELWERDLCEADPGAKVCNVLDFGGAQDVGKAITQAYLSCALPASKGKTNPLDTVILVPEGHTFNIHTHVVINAASFVTLQIDGIINVPHERSLDGTLLTFERSNNIVITGQGTINGNGAAWRPNRALNADLSRPRLIRFFQTDNSRITGALKLNNSPSFHVVIDGSHNVIEGLTIVADQVGTTDGVDLGGSFNEVRNVFVSNGDECVTVHSGTDMLISNITCSPSGGTNLGTFGVGGTDSIARVHYKGVRMINSGTAVMVKAFAGSKGSMQDVVFEDYQLTNVAKAVVISTRLGAQGCAHGTDYSCLNEGLLAVDSVQYRNISFVNWSGTLDATMRPDVSIYCHTGARSCRDINFINWNVKRLGGYADKYDFEANTVCGSGLKARWLVYNSGQSDTDPTRHLSCAD